MTTLTFADLWTVYKAHRVLGLKSEQETIRLYNAHVAPDFAAKRVDKITFLDIAALHSKLKDTPYQANRVLALIRAMFNFAINTDMVNKANPAKAVKMYPERKRRRHMKTAEAPRIALAILEKEFTCPTACLFLWLLIFTGARSGEIKAATWGDLQGNVIKLGSHKTVDQTGLDRVIVLPAAAINKINKLTTPDERIPHRRIVSLAAPEYLWQRDIRHAAGCPDLRIHDLRHTFGTYALEKGYSLDQIGEALNHSNPSTTKIYAELTDRSRQRMAVDTSIAIMMDMNVIETEEERRK